MHLEYINSKIDNYANGQGTIKTYDETKNDVEGWNTKHK